MFERGEASFQLAVSLTKLVDLFAELFDFSGLLLKLLRALVQLLDRRQAHARKIR